MKDSKVTKTIVHHSTVVGGFLYTQAKEITHKIDQKIDQNEKLAKARDTTKEKINVVGNAVVKGVSSIFKKIGFKKEEAKRIDPNQFETVDAVETAGN